MHDRDTEGRGPAAEASLKTNSSRPTAGQFDHGQGLDPRSTYPWNGGAGVGRLAMEPEGADTTTGQAPQQGEVPGRHFTSDLERRIEFAMRQGEVAMERYHLAARAKEILQRYPELAELLDLMRRF